MPRYIPLFILIALSAFFAFNLLYTDKKTITDNHIGTPFPVIAFDSFSSSDLKGDYALVNIFASWCAPCAIEHPALMELTATKKIKLYGIAWKDKPQNVSNYLKERGNPFSTLAIDTKGITTIALGLTGVPETFLIDKDGIIIYHTASALTSDVVNNDILPLITEGK